MSSKIAATARIIGLFPSFKRKCQSSSDEIFLPSSGVFIESAHTVSAARATLTICSSETATTFRRFYEGENWRKRIRLSLDFMANFFPRWSNWLPLKLAICGVLIVCGLTAGTWYYVTPKYTKVGYQPIQPVPFPHDIHVTQLGMDCRYCHSFVEVARIRMSRIPRPAWPVINRCRRIIRSSSRCGQAGRSQDPVEWVWIHRLPDYVFYNHAAHVNRGISCASCHGQVNHMPAMYDAKPMSMKWCLECHGTRRILRPEDQISNLDWKPEDVNPAEFVAEMRQTGGRNGRLV